MSEKTSGFVIHAAVFTLSLWSNDMRVSESETRLLATLTSASLAAHGITSRNCICISKGVCPFTCTAIYTFIIYSLYTNTRSLNIAP